MSQNGVSGCLPDWKACLERCVGPGVNYIQEDNTDTVIPLIKKVLETNLVIQLPSPVVFFSVLISFSFEIRPHECVHKKKKKQPLNTC